MQDQWNSSRRILCISQCQMQFRNAKIFAISNSQCENFAMRKFAMRKFRKVKFAMPNAISQCENTVHLSQPMRNFALRNSQPLCEISQTHFALRNSLPLRNSHLQALSSSVINAEPPSNLVYYSFVQ